MFAECLPFFTWCFVCCVTEASTALPPNEFDTSKKAALLENKGSHSAIECSMRPNDCADLLVAGNLESGVYNIYPFRCQYSPPIKVFCDMKTDGGGWTVFLSRENISKPINFTRNWADYKNGFGIPGQEHWLGNENLYFLTSSGNYILRMEAKDGFGRAIWGEWNSFKVEGEEAKYKITSNSANPQSTSADLFTTTHNGHFFTTYDMDNDKHVKLNCAENHKGGWWYNACFSIHPTGIYGRPDWKGLAISPWSKTDSSRRQASWIQLKIRPRVCSASISVAQINSYKCRFP